jgi:hypothetical protein
MNAMLVMLSSYRVICFVAERDRYRIDRPYSKAHGAEVAQLLSKSLSDIEMTKTEVLSGCQHTSNPHPLCRPMEFDCCRASG